VATTDRRHFLQYGVLVAGGLVAGERGRAAPPLVATKQSINHINGDKLEKIAAVIKEMMERSEKDQRDPKGWAVNAEPHKEFCSTSAISINQVHFCYWFLPWHRAYLYVFDKKLRELSGDSTLAFPYWNWSSYRRLPAAFTKAGSPLANARRFTPDRDLEPEEVDFIESEPSLRALGVAALGAEKFLTTPSTERIKFSRDLANSFGGVARPNNLSRFGNSRLEGVPHGPVHVYVGGESKDGTQIGDMTDFATAGLDPLFFAHHANLDRLWEKWRTIKKNRFSEPTGSEFVDHSFVFPWLDGTTIEVSVSDTLDTKRLGYIYDSLDVFDGGQPPVKPEAASGSTTRGPAVVSTTVAIPPVHEAAQNNPPQYTLIIEGLENPKRAMSATVLVSAAGRKSQTIPVGSIAVVRAGGEYRMPDDFLLFDITEAIKTLQNGRLKVEVVPNALGGEARRPYRPLKFKSMQIIVEDKP
jgi:polyphenol oxidase